jgi:hypothetical protein
MSTPHTPFEMFKELIDLGYIVPANIEPNRSMIPTAYISVPAYSGFHTPPVPTQKGSANAKLGTNIKRNTKRKRRS